MTLYSQIAKNKRKSLFYVAGFFVFAFAVGWFFSYTYEAGYLGIIYAGIVSVPMALISYYSSDKVALAVNAAKPIDPERSTAEKDLYRLVENITITAGIPVPKIYIIEDGAMNAFATGRDPKHASIAFTTGLLAKLDKNELEGVAAHELSHIRNYDIRLSTLVVILVGLIAILSDMFLRFGFFGRRRNDNNDNGGAGSVIAIIGLVLIILSPLIAQLISLAVSRRREFLADASGALLTRYPEGLARALQKISGDTDVLDHTSSATMHLYFTNPLAGKRRRSFSRFFSTHPPIEERIQALLGMDLAQFEREYASKK